MPLKAENSQRHIVHLVIFLFPGQEIGVQLFHLYIYRVIGNFNQEFFQAFALIFFSIWSAKLICVTIGI